MPDQVLTEEENVEESQETTDETTTEELEGGQSPEEETPQTVSIDGKEYTVNELKDQVEKASQYEKLLPDYTKKAQRLSELEGDNKQDEQKAPKEPWEDENWQPKDYKELQKAILGAKEQGKKEVLSFLENQKKQELETRQEVDNFVQEKTKSDKDFDEEEFFSYATRHKFPVNTIKDLEAVYSSYSELRKAGALGEQRALKNKGKRSEKVNASPEGKSEENAIDRKSILETSIGDRALGALEKLKTK